MPPFKRAFRGLYHNRMIQFGNRVSFAENKSRRTWKPNVQKKTMFSPSLNRKLSFRMTTHAMRCVKKAGGIEEYLIKTPDATIKYDKAIAIKRELIEIRKEQRKELKQAIEKSEAGVAVDAVGVNNDIGVLKKTPVAKLRSAGLLDALE